MSNNQIQNDVIQILSGILEQEIKLETSREDIQTWDSLKNIEVIFAIEDRFGIRFSEEEILTFSKVNDIVEKVKAKISNEA